MKIAIYSRKSKFTGKGESIENQVVLCREYIQRNIPEAKDSDILVYEDEGFSAKNLDRPQFRMMMQSARKQPFDYIVVYRLDRISRNVGDFATLIEELNGMNTAFVCIKEQFDTSTPMGRAMMNIAAVFAQLERETIAERVRDNLVLLARTGRWLGGVTPLGFVGEKTAVTDAEGKNRSAYELTVVEGEMSRVRTIYAKFLEFQSLTKVATWCIQNNIKTREGSEFRMRTVRDILTNPVYCTADEAAFDYFTKLGSDVCFEREKADGKHGLMPFHRTEQNGKKQLRLPPEEWIISLGKHKPIIPSEEWIKAQEIISGNAGKSFYRPVRNQVSVFSGLVRCANCGSIMRPRINSNARREADGSQTFYYMCELKERSRLKNCQMCNVNGNVLDKLLCDEIMNFNKPSSNVGKQLDSILRQIEKKTGGNREQTEELTKQLSEKKRMIANLMKTLAMNEPTSTLFEYTKNEVERLDSEIKNTENELAKLSYISEQDDKRSEHVDMLVRSLGEFRERFAELSVVDKRDFMRKIIDRIEWDGENAHIFLRRTAG